jgi:hypothetical protein
LSLIVEVYKGDLGPVSPEMLGKWLVLAMAYRVLIPAVKHCHVSLVLVNTQSLTRHLRMSVAKAAAVEEL